MDKLRQVKADSIDLFFFVPLRNGGEVEGELLVMIDDDIDVCGVEM